MVGTLFVLPGLVALMALSAVYAGFGDTLGVEALFAGVAPAVLAIVASAVVRVAGRSLRNGVLVGVAVSAFVALFLFRVPFPLVIAGAAAFGLVGERLRPARFAAPVRDTNDTGPGPVISDDALHGAAPSLRRALRILAVGGVLWAVPVLALLALFGSGSVSVDQGRFFSETAVVTFGGAYAVLAYIAQRAVLI